MTDTNASQSLLPCPFCGLPMMLDVGVISHADNVEASRRDCPLKYGAWAAACHLPAWNTRTPPASQSEYGRIHRDGSRSGGQPVGTNASQSDEALVEKLARELWVARWGSATIWDGKEGPRWTAYGEQKKPTWRKIARAILPIIHRERSAAEAEAERLVEACKRYDAALLIAFPHGAKGAVLDEWNAARIAVKGAVK